jgi:uncharacterized OsmC-like protein
MSERIAEAVARTKQVLETDEQAGRSPDRPATAVVEEGLRCRVEGPDGWTLVTDMPPALGGEGSAPTSSWFLRAAWAACDATMVALRAAELGIPVVRIEVTAESQSDSRGLLGVRDDVPAGPLAARNRIRIAAEGVDPAQLRDIVEWADRHSPVGDALRRAIDAPVELEIVEAERARS